MLGSALALKLIQGGHDVRILVHRTRHPRLEGLGLETAQGDLLDPPSLERAMEGCSTCFHTAGLVSYARADDDNLYRVNVLGTRNVLKAARNAGIERLIHTSSTAAVGASDSPERILDETSPFHPQWERVPYMGTKRLAEDAVRAAVISGLEAVIVNPSTIYGNGDINQNTSRVIHSVKEGKLAAVPSGGSGWVGLDDVVLGHLLAAEKGRSAERYILSSENLNHFETLNRMALAVGGRGPRWTLPSVWAGPVLAAAWGLSLIRSRAAFSPAFARVAFRYRYFSSAKAHLELGWNPRQTLEEAVAQALAS